MQITIEAQKSSKVLARLLFNAGKEMLIIDAKMVDGVLHITVTLE